MGCEGRGWSQACLLEWLSVDGCWLNHAVVQASAQLLRYPYCLPQYHAKQQQLAVQSDLMNMLILMMMSHTAGVQKLASLHTILLVARSRSQITAVLVPPTSVMSITWIVIPLSTTVQPGLLQHDIMCVRQGTTMNSKTLHTQVLAKVHSTNQIG